MSVSRFFLVLFLLSSFSPCLVAQQETSGPEAGRYTNTDEVILVAGATGRTGSHVVKQLKGFGYKNILGMTRDKENAISAGGPDIDWI